MKKYVPIMLSLFLLAACESSEESVKEKDTSVVDQNVTVDTTKNNDESSNNEATSSDNSNASTTKNVATEKNTSDFQGVVPSKWNVTMPNMFPIEQGSYVSAITNLEANTLTFQFYKTVQSYAINDTKIKDNGSYLGQVTITQFESKELASKEIDQTVFKDGEVVDLGHGITGYQDAGAGSLFTSWNEGRWAIIARSLTEKAEESVQTAKATVEYLESHTLPIPKDYGYLHVDAEQKGTMAKWQKGQYVFVMTDFGDDTLPWLVTFK